jgi:hypothetical protein
VHFDQRTLTSASLRETLGVLLAGVTAELQRSAARSSGTACSVVVVGILMIVASAKRDQYSEAEEERDQFSDHTVKSIFGLGADIELHAGENKQHGRKSQCI